MISVVWDIRYCFGAPGQVQSVCVENDVKPDVTRNEEFMVKYRYYSRLILETGKPAMSVRK